MVMQRPYFRFCDYNIVVDMLAVSVQVVETFFIK